MLDTFYFETLSINSLFYILDIYTSASHLYCIMPLFVLDFIYLFIYLFFGYVRYSYV